MKYIYIYTYIYIYAHFYRFRDTTSIYVLPIYRFAASFTFYGFSVLALLYTHIMYVPYATCIL